jgi:arsenate reductase-like glutaredoxin family protein
MSTGGCNEEVTIYGEPDCWRAHAARRERPSALREGWDSPLRSSANVAKRPVVIHGNRAVLGRPTENVLDLID